MMMSRTSPRYICNVVGEHDKSLAGIMTMFRIMALCKGDHSGSIVNSSCKKDFSRFMKMEQSLSHANVLRSQIDACITFLIKGLDSSGPVPRQQRTKALRMDASQKGVTEFSEMHAHGSSEGWK